MNDQPGVGLKIGRRRGGRMGTAIRADAERQRTGENRRAFDEVAARRLDLFCAAPLTAVAEIAVLIRLYVQ